MRAQELGLIADGLIPYALRFNLDTADLLAENNFSYVIGQPTEAYIGSYYAGGVRNPAFMRLRGTRTDVVLLPATAPLGNRLEAADVDGFVRAWREIIDGCAQNGDMGVIVLDPEALDGAAGDKIIGLLEYAKERGLMFESPGSVADHYRLAMNVDSSVSLEDDSVKVEARNMNPINVSGITYRIRLPPQDEGCLYRAEGAVISRATRGADGCTIYATIDIAGNRSAEFSVVPI